jgi:hexosaminidase
MKIRYIIRGLLILFVLQNQALFCQQIIDTSINIIPKPLYIELHKGNFTINSNTRLLVFGNDSLVSKQAEFLNDAIKNTSGICLKIDNNRKNLINNFIRFQIVHIPELGTEGYKLEVYTNSIIIQANDAHGLFYGIQSLLQLLPPEIFSSTKVENIKLKVPCLLIKDKPNYAYRGMHLDVSRHFFPKEFIKKYLDLMAMYKMNYFHWHLTDDNGWRIEIKKYPLLTKISAWRVDREKQPWDKWSPIKSGEKATYGGYYTQKDIKEIIRYAADRFITVIPEIEMPAHTSEVFAAYPQYSCTGDTLSVCPGSYWPNKDLFCAGNDSTFTFIENILSEVCNLFPGPYIHIGGDEADKTLWDTCPKCKGRIQSEGLKSVDDLQSYFINRIDKFLISKHKKMIGWDEIMEGNLSPQATVMCWNGIFKGIEAAKQDHDVIMTPTKYCYFDYYQANPAFDSLGTGGVITLKDVYSFDPSPSDLNEKEAKHILGAQANLWTEYIKTPDRAEYMILPRMLALSEDVWSGKENKNWVDFLRRVNKHYQIFNAMGLDYSHGSYAVKIKPFFNDTLKQFKVTFDSEQLHPKIYYTLDGNDPDTNSIIYNKPFLINKTTTIKAAIFKNNIPIQGITKMTTFNGYELGKKIFYAEPPSEKYIGENRNNTLIDGLRGSTYFYDGNWQGFLKNNFDVIIDLGTSASVNKISVDFLHNLSSWIFLPLSINISVSADGIDYQDFKSYLNTAEQETDSLFIKVFNEEINGMNIRFIHIIAKNIGVCPSWHVGAGEPAWLFCDEILIE